jgi:hypothetical protein
MTREESEAATAFFTWYFVVRALLARAHSLNAATAWTSSPTIRTTRTTHSSPFSGSSGSPKTRRWWAYSSNAACPEKTLRLPYMWRTR